MKMESPHGLPLNVFIGGVDDMHGLDPRLRGGDKLFLIVIPASGGAWMRRLRS